MERYRGLEDIGTAMLLLVIAVVGISRQTRVGGWTSRILYSVTLVPRRYMNLLEEAVGISSFQHQWAINVNRYGKRTRIRLHSNQPQF